MDVFSKQWQVSPFLQTQLPGFAGCCQSGSQRPEAAARTGQSGSNTQADRKVTYERVTGWMFNTGCPNLSDRDLQTTSNQFPHSLCKINNRVKHEGKM